ncbi:hypothetical protein THARTR1_04965 [Trichoderma harzianum]|uniref:Uncharacterized protein n=1 Tax=Trichoderma harzianum TaxID=5544 RepID=A0A2K0UAG5_TRIHA|nr:hypothetical protein THARTR1_04965 [Trichoderma harzianum]
MGDIPDGTRLRPTTWSPTIETDAENDNSPKNSKTKKASQKASKKTEKKTSQKASNKSGKKTESNNSIGDEDNMNTSNIFPTTLQGIPYRLHQSDSNNIGPYLSGYSNYFDSASM